MSKTQRKTNNKMHRIHFHLTLPAVLCAALLATSSSAQDKVYPKQGVSVSGKISKINPNEVVIEVRGKDQTFPLADLRKISFDGEPNGLDRAREQVILGQYSQALDDLKKLAAADLKSVSVQQDFEFYRWYAEGKLGLAGSGDKNNAIRGLVNLAKKNSNTHHFFALCELLGELSLSVGQPDRATTYFGQLSSATDPVTKARGFYQLGQVELAQDKVAEAKGQFEKLKAAPSNSPEMLRLKTLGEVGLAVCENLQGNSQAALDSLNALVQKNDSSDQALFAKIKNAQGACYAALKQPKLAVVRYLQTDLLFFTAPEAHAEALYHLSQLWPEIGDPARGAEARSRLVSQYAASTWANK